MQFFTNKVVIETNAGSVMDEAVGGLRRPTFARRWLDALSSVIPTVILVLLPKCPVCVAA